LSFVLNSLAESTEILVHGEHEQSAYNGYFESPYYHPLLMFNRDGDCMAAKLRPGKVQSADGCEELLLPEMSGNKNWARKLCFVPTRP
jgi:hypothetical protein